MPTNDEITARLAEMLNESRNPNDTDLWDSETRAAEGLPARQPIAPDIAASVSRNIEAAQATDTRSPSRDQAAEQPWLYTGRGPTGRLRNFRAMNDIKLRATLRSIEDEANDSEALVACSAEFGARGL